MSVTLCGNTHRSMQQVRNDCLFTYLKSKKQTTIKTLEIQHKHFTRTFLCVFLL